MVGFVHLPESLSISFHALVLMAAEHPCPVTQPYLAETFNVSLAHLTKVMPVLRRMGLVNSVRGPSGGFVLARDPSEILLIDVVNAFQSVTEAKNCLLTCPACPSKSCSLGKVVAGLENQFIKYLSNTNLVSLSQSAGFKVKEKS